MSTSTIRRKLSRNVQTGDVINVSRHQESNWRPYRRVKNVVRNPGETFIYVSDGHGGNRVLRVDSNRYVFFKA